MYLDIYGYITGGIGNLLDPIGTALGLAWLRYSDHQLATHQEIVDEWGRMHARAAFVLVDDPDHPGQQKKHWTCPPPNPLSGGGAFKHVAQLYLDEDGIAQLVAMRLTLNEAHLRERFPLFDSWPAAAQLALHFFAWAAGPGLDFVATKVIDGIYPRFAACLYAGDFAAAVAECWIASDTRDAHGNRIPNPKNPGLFPRNLAIVALLEEASQIAPRGADPDVLYWPAAVPFAPDVAPTEPEGLVPPTSEVFPNDGPTILEGKIDPPKDG